MSITELLAGWLGVDDVRSIDAARVTFAAPWAQDGPAWVFFGCIGLIVAGGLFYLRHQGSGRPRARAVLGVLRASLLCALLVILAEPILTVDFVRNPRPLLWLLFDGTDSMAIEDRLGDDRRRELEAAVGGAETGVGDSERPRQRVDFVSSWLRHRGGEALSEIASRSRLRTFLFEGDGVIALDTGAEEAPGGRASVDRGLYGDALARQLTTRGEVTALGAALDDLSRRSGASRVAGLVIVGDFGQNSGPSALDAASRLGVPIWAIGVGPETATDLSVDLQAPVLLKKDERATLSVRLGQTGLDGRTARVRVTARSLGSARGSSAVDGVDESVDGAIVLEERDVELSAASVVVDVGFEPRTTGRYRLAAFVEPLGGEVVEQNNRAEREVGVRDDFLRLMYVEYEPTWEWRFIKEVFHRDRLVGMRGFRTFLRSADPKVRHANELFLPTMTPRRGDFFANDVIFLGDVPAGALTERFCAMTREFVSVFGGGLVVIAGPRFGPGELAGTVLADMLPVVADRDAPLRDDREFRLARTIAADGVEFMRLGESDEENERAWDNLGRLPWYRPVERLHPLATALATHPVDRCADGETLQPLIALRRYGKGEVVYLGFDETWRLRRGYGERYYRRFWGQMIYRLGLSHALGSQKRFVVRTDRQRYRSDDRIVVTVEAYDANFEPLHADDLPGRVIEAALIAPANGQRETEQRVNIPLLREGLFETRLYVASGGEHRLRVTDPVTSEVTEVTFEVADVSAERQSAVRDVGLQRELALRTGGRAYDLENAHELVDDIRLTQRRETGVAVLPLWNTWLCFALVVGLMLGEWAGRKWVGLA